jgi:hypothetical protein
VFDFTGVQDLHVRGCHFIPFYGVTGGATFAVKGLGGGEDGYHVQDNSARGLTGSVFANGLTDDSASTPPTRILLNNTVN